MKLSHFLASALLAGSLSAVADDDLTPEQIAGHPAVQGAASLYGAWLEGRRFYDEVPGIAAGIVYDQQLIWTGNYGYSNVGTQRPMDSDTIFSICSISKLFTSIGIMQLRDAGKLRLSDPVAEHLDWYDIEQAHEESAAVTIQSLLTHSSGLPRESDFNYWAGPDFPFPTREVMIEQLGKQETLYPASMWFQYSNLALTLAGEIVQSVSGEDYADYIREQILDPLELADTRSFYPEELRGEQLAIGYRGHHREGSGGEVKPFFARAITPAAGFTSTVNDLARFAMWQFRLLDNSDDAVLASNTLREMQRVHWVDPDWETTWGLGFNVFQEDGMTVVGHGGGCPGYITQYLMNPKDRIAVVVLTNAGDGAAYDLALGGIKLMTAAIGDISEMPTDTPDYSAYEGSYEGKPWGDEVAIRQAGDYLLVVSAHGSNLDGDVTRLEHQEGDTFVRLTDDGEPRETWTFLIGDDGKARALRTHSSESTRVEF